MLGKKQAKKPEIGTLIGAGTTLTGDIAFSGGMHVDGEVCGNVVGQAGTEPLISLSGKGRVEGSVEASEVIVNGTVEGDVIARDRVELGPTARVTGNVIYGRVQMAVGAEVNGKLIHRPTATPVIPPEEPRAGAAKAAADDAADDAMGIS
jgi:cytoskeletal protein CcmA (bactofilin family)